MRAAWSMLCMLVTSRNPWLCALIRQDTHSAWPLQMQPDRTAICSASATRKPCCCLLTPCYCCTRFTLHASLSRSHAYSCQHSWLYILMYPSSRFVFKFAFAPAVHSMHAHGCSIDVSSHSCFCSDHTSILAFRNMVCACCFAIPKPHCSLRWLLPAANQLLSWLGTYDSQLQD